MQAPLIKQGWLRVFIFLVMFLLVALGVQMLLSIFDLPITGKFYTFIFSYTISAIAFLLLTWLFKKVIDKEPFSTVGLSWAHYKHDGGIGLFSAIALLCLGTLVLAFAGKIIFTSAEANPQGLLIILGMMAIVAFMEEVVFRGYVLYNLMSSMNKWLALVISAIAFAAVHATNPNVDVLPLINIFLAGLLFGINYVFTRNLWFAIAFHFAWNFTQGAILGYKVSGINTPAILQQHISGKEIWTGGEFGFEGSLLCTILLFVSIVLMYYIFAHKYKSSTSG